MWVFIIGVSDRCVFLLIVDLRGVVLNDVWILLVKCFGLGAFGVSCNLPRLCLLIGDFY